MSVPENFNKIKALIPENVELVAVSKFHPVEKIKEVYDCGQRVFGENKVQELLSKVDDLPKDIQSLKRQYNVSFAEAKDYALTNAKALLIEKLERQANS